MNNSQLCNSQQPKNVETVAIVGELPEVGLIKAKSTALTASARELLKS